MYYCLQPLNGKYLNLHYCMNKKISMMVLLVQSIGLMFSLDGEIMILMILKDIPELNS